jgi:single-stranded DNA-binding protein
MSYNHVGIQGNLVEVPVVRGNEEKPVVNFRIGNTTGFGEYEKNTFITCVAFGPTAKAMASCVNKGLLPKGRQIMINGQLVQNNWEDKDSGDKRSSLEVHLDRFNGFDFTGNNQDREAAPAIAGGDDTPF